MNKDLYYMKEAYKEAVKAYQKNEVPVGCVIVCDDKIIARGHNLRHNLKCSLYHAEIIAIKKASKKLNTWILDNCVMYVTLEPCLMCSGAIIQSRIKKVYYGIEMDRFGCFNEALDYFKHKQNHNVDVEKGLMKEEIEELMKNFFKELREVKY